MAPARKNPFTETPAKPPAPEGQGPTQDDTAESAPPVSICRWVVYRLSGNDSQRIEARRVLARRRTKFTDGWPKANDTYAGQQYPLLVVVAHQDGSVNGRAFLDGEDDLWVTSVKQGDAEGQWDWPERV